MDGVTTTCARCRGLSLVEAALVLPIVVMLTFALIEYGWLFLQAQQLSNAARHGARLAVLPDTTTQHVNDQIATMLADAGLGDSGYTVQITPADVTLAESGETVTVSVTVTYANIGLARMGWIPLPSEVGGAVTMAKEGP